MNQQRRGGRRYAVVFCEQGGRAAAGCLELGDEELLLTGGDSRHRREITVHVSDIADVRVGRGRGERLNGYRTLVVHRSHLPAVQIAPLGVGLIAEIAELLVALTAPRPHSDEELVVVVPLRPGSLPRARELLAAGPPLDPASLGLTSHHVYLTDQEATFVFTGPDVHARLRQAARKPALWRAGLAWQECINGRPTLTSEKPRPDAQPLFTWTAQP